MAEVIKRCERFVLTLPRVGLSEEHRPGWDDRPHLALASERFSKSAA
jgi:hypothetical protein